MSDLPFGFGPSDPDDSRREGSSGSGDGGSGSEGSGHGGFGFGPGGAGGNPFAAFGGGAGGPGGFDLGQLGQMLTQLGQMLSSSGGPGGGDGPVNYKLAAQMAHQQITVKGAPTAEQRTAVEESVRLAELWLDDATTLPSGVSTVTVWSPDDWVDATVPTWQRLCDPVARRVANAWVEGLPGEAREMAGPMLGMISQVGGMAFGSQLGSALGQLAGEVLTSSDIGLPLGPEGTAALLPDAVARFTEGLDRPAGEVLVFLAAREAAHHRLFGHVPWLRQRLLATVEEFAHGITIDTSRIEELARDLDPSNPAAIEQAMSSGLFEPQTTEAQKAALTRLETLLALVEGWVDLVVAQAVGDRLPGADALRESMRRRRASGGPAEQTFATLVGLELRPRRLRDASELWRRLGEERDVDGRDAVWAHPDLLPTAEDLDDPAAFVRGRSALGEEGGDGGSFSDLDDPIARLEQEMRAEKESGTSAPDEGSTGTAEGKGGGTDGSTDDEGPGEPKG
ncbi:zinc-dependent metalloprotease [Actinomycetospora sp. TBRC 11914]|uniref:zinc-dependent metalloprotease n=1 Tax=Actinomycetospora sp. TBRC 11914 TaxID=2729387 RepID=UPI00145C3BA7|nr:zinc-dependent metalloprotease [Actinomycetospora sp. TBRC 11914]NMO88714.1 zinc-dependent metalloprotease [Actinomycetospora sp. TBRC 11914]